MKANRWRTLGLVCWLMATSALPGCAFGPKVLEKTHGRYSNSVRRVTEEQLLRNLVRLRYGESPFELNVSSIASQYEIAGGAEARPFFIAPNPSNSNVIFKTFTSILPDLTVSGANRPTITMIPADNGEVVRRFLTPIPTETVAFLSESSWPVSVVLRLWVERLNGVPNAITASGPALMGISEYQRFLHAADLFQEAQRRELLSIRTEPMEIVVGGPVPAQAMNSSAVVDAARNGMEYRPENDGLHWVLVRKEDKLRLRINQSAEHAPEIEELISILNLTPDETYHNVVVSPGNVPDPMLSPRPPSSELRMTTRSTSQVFFYLSKSVEVPCEHLESGIAPPLADEHGEPVDGRELTRGILEIKSCKSHLPPPTAYLAIENRGYWFYIDDRDHASKSTLSLVLQLSRLDFANQKAAAPLLTLPVGR